MMINTFNLDSEDVHEEPESESEVSSCAGLDPDYNPNYKSASSYSEDLSPDRGASSCKSLSSDEEHEGSGSLSEHDERQVHH